MRSFYSRLVGKGKPVPIEHLLEIGVPAKVVAELQAMGGTINASANENKKTGCEEVRDAS